MNLFYTTTKFLPLVLALSVFLPLIACNGNKPLSNDPVDAARAADKAGINITKNPGAGVKPEDLKDGERITVVGMLREVGTARFSRLVLTPPANFDINLLLNKEQLPDFPKLQYKFIEVTGVVKVQIVHFGTIEQTWYSITVESARHIQR